MGWGLRETRSTMTMTIWLWNRLKIRKPKTHPLIYSNFSPLFIISLNILHLYLSLSLSFLLIISNFDSSIFSAHPLLLLISAPQSSQSSLRDSIFHQLWTYLSHLIHNFFTVLQIWLLSFSPSLSLVFSLLPILLHSILFNSSTVSLSLSLISL